MAARDRQVPRWALAVVLAALALSGGVFVGHGLAAAPPLDALAPSAVTLSARVEREVPGQRSTRGPYAIFRWDDGQRRATVEHLCFLSGCAIPPQLAHLKAGDRVTLWTRSDEVWQVAQDGRRLLSYEAVRSSFDAAMHRRLLVEVPLWLSMAGMVILVLLRRGRRDASTGSGEPRRAVWLKFRVKWGGPGADARSEGRRDLR